MTGFVQDLLRDAAGAFFGSEYLRDYTHASKTFRTNTYENAPKLKFLFHTYFDINPAAYVGTANFGLLVKEIKLPTFTPQTVQLNQYNRKRIVQTKIKYEPIEISFHDDAGNQVNRLWQSYYTYYYNDGNKPGAVLSGNRGGTPGVGVAAAGYNDRTQYNPSITGQDDWGFVGGSSSAEGKRVPFFKNITVFGFDKHRFTAYTLINPVITSFSHDTYNYAEGGGTMANRMTIDYETVVYDAGMMDGRSPANIVTGFGSEANYDTRLSPIAKPGSNATILGQGGLVDAVGGALTGFGSGTLLGALQGIQAAGTAYNTFKNTNIGAVAKTELNTMLINSLQNTPNTRNTLFNFPTAKATPGPAGLAASPPIGAATSPDYIAATPTAGTQNSGA
jgi:hypothetical protein